MNPELMDAVLCACMLSSHVENLPPAPPSILLHSLLFFYLNSPSVSRLYSVDDRVINKCEAPSGMRIGRENLSTRKNVAQCQFVLHKSHVTTWDRTRAAAAMEILR
jgi:hypothetical protein